MREEIYKICTKLNDGQIAVTEATEQLLLLFSVKQSEQLPNYTMKGDYCAVCGGTEFWNDEED